MIRDTGLAKLLSWLQCTKYLEVCSPCEFALSRADLEAHDSSKPLFSAPGISDSVPFLFYLLLRCGLI